MVRDFRTMLF